jgi:hypothetical protein
VSRIFRYAALSAAILGVGAIAAWAGRDDNDYPYIPYDHASIQYKKATPTDAITKLQEKLDNGSVKLAYDPKWGYLPSLLKHLNVNVDSQMLVFSKTSFQGPKISPAKPRALYFNDDVAVGFVQDGDVMEFTALDPKLGINFYTMEREKTDKPSFFRRTDECFSCHLIPGTLYVPGLLTTSVYPRPDGALRFQAAALFVDHRTPLDQRWGGWYVTGNAGDLQHRGNSVAPNPDQPTILDLRNNQNLTSLARRFDTTAYLTGTSDLIALMTLEHQTRMTSMLTRLRWEYDVADQEGKLAQFQPRMEFLTDELVSYMLFVGEAKMYNPMSGVSTFTESFQSRGPKDKQGRSLRNFDLKTRLFRYPLSYMIYDAAFDALPEQAKASIYQKAFDVLTGKNTDEKFSRLSAADRRAIREILAETKPSLPDYWR